MAERKLKDEGPMKSQKSQARVLVAALLTVGLSFIAGCSGCGQPQVESVLAVTFSKPTDGQQLAPLDKSNPAAPGFAVDVTVLGADSNGRSITLSDAKLEIKASAATDWSAGPAAQLNGASALFAGAPLSAGSNMLRTTVTEKDSLRQATRTITVTVPGPIGCSVSFTTPSATPFVYNLSFDEDPSTPGLQTTVRGVTPKCMGFPVSLYKGAGASTLLGTATADVTTGAFAIPITLQDLEQTRLTAQMADPFPPNPVSSAVADVSVKISPPVITNPSPAIPTPLTTLYYVADSNIYLLQPDAGLPDAGYIKNKVTTDNAVADFAFTVAQANGGTARLVYQGANLALPVPINSDPKIVSWTNVPLPQQTTGMLQFLATDSAGNSTVVGATTTVDVIPPAPSAFAALTLPTDGGARTATVNATWTASGDDGLDGGNPAGYDVRWSTLVVLPSGVGTDGGFYDPNQFQPGGVQPGNATSGQISPLPPLNTYFFQVRPFDRVGNYARTSAQSQLNNMLSTVALTNPDSNYTGYGLHLAKADFDGDGTDDLVVASPCLAGTPCASTNSGAVYIYYGSRTGAFGTTHQTLTPPDGQIRFYGGDVSTGNVGDILGDVARPDLLVGQPSWHFGTAQAGTGRVFLYFGHTGQQLDPTNHRIEFRGRAAGTQFGAAAQVIPDINGDGLSEVAISAPFEDRVYIFYGRSETQWQALRVVDAPLWGDSVAAIPATAANKIIAGPTGTFFGRLNGYANLGDISGDGGISFTIPNSLDTVNNLYVYTGPVVNGVPDGGFLDAGMASQVLNQPFDGGTGTTNGFGARAFGNVNIVGGPAKDLVVTHPKNNKIYIYPDGTATQFSNPPQVINGNGNFGFSLSYGDINGDGRGDIVAGENASAFSSVWIFYNKGILGREYDSAAAGGFSQSRLLSNFSLGIDVVVGDFNGDGLPDVAAADHLDGTGKVTVWQ
ncbi:MAG TPA: FG-GAP-like repeat-containing protein [Myxococcaceae bacterium]|nr:FG-GAP-like repeat-containing protein [Myxococcaceae bacterium]